MKSAKQIKVALIVGAVVSLAGCQTTATSEQIGTGIGIVVGGAAGSAFGSGLGQVAGVAIGAGIGGVIGNAIGRTANYDDDQYAYRAFIGASQAPAGDSVYWRNGRTGHWGYFCPLRDGHTRVQGDYCRDFMSTAYINGKTERTRGRACRQPDGVWYPN